jgi:hypothetical protein
MAKAGLARLEELVEGGAATDEVIDRLRAGLQAIGTTRARLDQDPGPERALTERELRGYLISAEGAELSRLYKTAPSMPPSADGSSGP